MEHVAIWASGIARLTSWSRNVPICTSALLHGTICEPRSAMRPAAKSSPASLTMGMSSHSFTVELSNALRLRQVGAALGRTAQLVLQVSLVVWNLRSLLTAGLAPRAGLSLLNLGVHRSNAGMRAATWQHPRLNLGRIRRSRTKACRSVVVCVRHTRSGYSRTMSRLKMRGPQGACQRTL